MSKQPLCTIICQILYMQIGVHLTYIILQCTNLYYFCNHIYIHNEKTTLLSFYFSTNCY